FIPKNGRTYDEAPIARGSPSLGRSGQALILVVKKDRGANQRVAVGQDRLGVDGFEATVLGDVDLTTTERRGDEGVVAVLHHRQRMEFWVLLVPSQLADQKVHVVLGLRPDLHQAALLDLGHLTRASADRD